MNSRLRLLTFFVAVLVPLFAFPDAVIPTEDIEGASDTDVIGRFEGSFIIDYKHSDFDEISVPLAPLERVPGEKDSRNNSVHRAPETLDLEGSRTRIVYLMPAGVSPLQVLRNYQGVVESNGGSCVIVVLPRNSFSLRQSVASRKLFVWPRRRIGRVEGKPRS